MKSMSRGTAPCPIQISEESDESRMRAFNSAILVGLFLIAVGAPAATPDSIVSAALRAHGGRIELSIVNSGKEPISIDRHASLAGLSGGNVIAIILSRHGQLMPPCVHLDHFTPSGKTRPIEAGSERTVWSGSAKPFAWTHCLDPGSYSFSIAYLLPNKQAVFSNSLMLRVEVGGAVVVE